MGFSLCFRYRADTQTYQPYNKDWIKEKIYVLLRRQAQQASKWKASEEHGGVLTIVFLTCTCVWTCGWGSSMTIYISDVGEEDLNALLSIKVSFQQCVSLPSSSSSCVCKLTERLGLWTRLDLLWCTQPRPQRWFSFFYSFSTCVSIHADLRTCSSGECQQQKWCSESRSSPLTTLCWPGSLNQRIFRTNSELVFSVLFHLCSVGNGSSQRRGPMFSSFPLGCEAKLMDVRFPLRIFLPAANETRHIDFQHPSPGTFTRSRTPEDLKINRF